MIITKSNYKSVLKQFEEVRKKYAQLATDDSKKAIIDLLGLLDSMGDGNIGQLYKEKDEIKELAKTSKENNKTVLDFVSQLSIETEMKSLKIRKLTTELKTLQKTESENRKIIDELSAWAKRDFILEVKDAKNTSKVEIATKIKIGDVFIFGKYPQCKSGKRSTPIKWDVIDIKNGKALLISKYALDSKQYNKSDADVTWETCSLRKWLNGVFFKNAFSKEEQKSIIRSIVTADYNPKYPRWPGNDTIDKVFLLSITEVNKYFSSLSTRKCKRTAYCYAQGVQIDSHGNCMWWLRSPGNHSSCAASIYYGGSICGSGIWATYDYVAVRPAMWINLK